MTEHHQRFAKASVGHGLSLTVRIVEQVVMTPVLISAWGTEVYASWLIITAIPTFLSFSELGFTTSASNEITRRSETGIGLDLQIFYARIFTVFLLWTILFGSAATVFTLFFPISEMLGISAISQTAVVTILLLSLAQLVMSQISHVLSAGLRATRQYHADMMLRAVVSLVRLLVVVACVLGFGASPTTIAVITSLTVLATLFSQEWYLRNGGLATRIALSLGNEKMLPYFKHGLFFMIVPLSSALAVQGSIVGVGTFMSATALAAFSTHRTLSRFVLQLMQIATGPLQAEVGLLQDTSRRAAAADLTISVSRVVFWASLGAIAFLIVKGDWIFHLWIKEGVPFLSTVFFLLLLSAVFEGIWRAAVAFQLGTNNHKRAVTTYLALSVTGFVFMIAAAKWGTLIHVAAIPAVADAVMCVLIARLNERYLGITAAHYFLSLLRPPVRELGLVLTTLKRRR